MIKKVFLFASFLVLTLPNIAFASGGAIYKKAKCFECHGEIGQGNREKNAPRIAGQHDWYILNSLKAFKSRKRVNREMFPYIKNLSENDFQALAAYLSKL